MIGLGLLRKATRDYFTGPDGQSYALGKALAVLMFLLGAPLPHIMLLTGKPVSLTDAGVFYGALGAAVMALVWGTNPAEPREPTK